MFNITAVKEWVANIRGISTTDPLLGGEDGELNAGLIGLVKRTLYLKDAIANVGDGDSTKRFKVADAVTDDEAVNKRQHDTKLDFTEANKYFFNAGKTKVDETANRIENTVYTNTTGEPILVSILAEGNYSARVALKVDDDVVSQGSDKNTTAYSRASASAFVPNGSTYEGISFINMTKWYETK